MVFDPFRYMSALKGKTLLPIFRMDLCSEGVWCAGNQKGKSQKLSLVKYTAENLLECIKSPLHFYYNFR